MENKTKVVGSVILLGTIATLGLAISGNAQGLEDTQNSVRSSPHDATNYSRPAIPEDLAPGGRTAISALAPVPLAPFPVVFIRDAVVSNTDPNLTNTDTFGDEEPSIAVNWGNPNEIVLTAFSGSWGANAPLWHSTNAGAIWTKRFTIPVPPGVPSAFGCPCDQTVDYGDANQLSGTFLSFRPTDVYSGTTTDPTMASAWNWLAPGGVTQRTNSTGLGNADQPQLLVGIDPVTLLSEVVVAYDNFSGAPDMRIAVAVGTNPPDFTIDNLTGFSAGAVNPGHRLAIDQGSATPTAGTIYSLFQQCPTTVLNCNNIFANPKTINYVLNRSTDGGRTWGLNGSPTGIIVATAQSTQPFPKFGTVNALLGGVDSVAADPNTGGVYVVYGNRDPNTGNNRLSIVGLTDNGVGGLTIGPSFFVTGQVQAALPSVAVTFDSRHTVGVLYDTFDGFSGGFPVFSAHLALSQDQGMTFTDAVLETFLSPAQDNGNPRQRVLGDYQQLKAVELTFYGVFTGNGVPFGRPFSNNDPIFFSTDAP